MINVIVNAVYKLISSDQLKEWATEGIDLLIEKIKATESSIDDAIVIPLLEMVKEAFDLDESDTTAAES